MNVYRAGYQSNDVYAEYLKLGSPQSLSREQVQDLAKKTDGRPVESSRISVTTGRTFSHDLPMRENDVYLVTLAKQ